MKQFIIPTNTPSSKNGKIKTRWGLVKNKLTQKWEKDTAQYFIDNKDEFLKAVEGMDKPYKIYFSFQRKSRHRSDFQNLVQGVTDQMRRYGWIDDDDLDNVLPIPFIDEKTGKCHIWNKDFPCTIITIL